MYLRKFDKNIVQIKSIINHWDKQTPEYVLEVLKELVIDYDLVSRKNMKTRAGNMAKPLDEAAVTLIGKFPGMTKGVLFNNLKKHLDFVNLDRVLKRLELDKKIVVVESIHKANRKIIYRYYMPGDEKY